jgi:hypothetical protein
MRIGVVANDTGEIYEPWSSRQGINSRMKTERESNEPSDQKMMTSYQGAGMTRSCLKQPVDEIKSKRRWKRKRPPNYHSLLSLTLVTYLIS